MKAILISYLTPDTLVSATFCFFMLGVAVIDWRRLIIPNLLVITGLVLGLAIKVLYEQNEILTAALSALSVFSLMAFIRFGASKAFKREAMGMGDVKLAGLLGLYLGMEGFLVALWAGAILGSVYGLLVRRRKPNVILRSAATKDLTTQESQILPATKMAGRHCVQNDRPSMVAGRDTRIPFGSFLAIASIVVMYFLNDIEAWLTLLQ